MPRYHITVIRRPDLDRDIIAESEQEAYDKFCQSPEAQGLKGTDVFADLDE